MLVCPTCHHELPVATNCNFSSVDTQQLFAANIAATHQQQLSTNANSTNCAANSKDLHQQCHVQSPTCHVTPTCHVSRTCHVTPACRVRAPCHVTPYVCGCSLNHNTAVPSDNISSNNILISSSTSSSTTKNLCSHNIAAPSGTTHVNTQQNQLDALNFRLFNLGSCPTSPSTPINQCNTWPSSMSQIISPNDSTCSPFPPSKDNLGVHHCSTSQKCSLQLSNNHHKTLHKSNLDISSSNLHVDAQNSPQPQLVCSNSLCSNTSRTNFGRQMSCPNAAPCVVIPLSCSCLQQQTSLDKYDHLTHQQHLNSKSFNPDLDKHINFNKPLHMQDQRQHHQQQQQQQQQQPISQFQFQVADQQQQQASEFCFQTELQPNKGDNIVILNSSSGGGMIIERKEPSRSNSPELKMTLSLPLSNSQTSSGSISPITVNTVSFDREALMQTLASLPTIATSTSSVFVSQPTTINSTCSTLSFSVPNHNLVSQTFSTISFPSVSPAQSTSSSCTPSPVSFAANDQLSCPDEIGTSSKINLNNFTSRSSATNANNTVNQMFSPAIHCFPGDLVAQAAVVDACDWTSADDARVLRKARTELEECGWYYGGLTWREAGAVLDGSSEGSFLVRDSWSGRCLYALSLQTSRGPTSVRIEYENGKFRLESETGARDGVPQRSSVVALVQAYTQTRNPAHVWVDHSGLTVSAISVKKPLRKNPPSLQHVARLAYNAMPDKQGLIDSGIPNLIKAYLNSYPHSC